MTAGVVGAIERHAIDVLNPRHLRRRSSCVEIAGQKTSILPYAQRAERQCRGIEIDQGRRQAGQAGIVGRIGAAPHFLRQSF